MLSERSARFRLMLFLATGMAIAAVLVLAGVGRAQEQTTVSSGGSASTQSVIPDDSGGEPARFLVPTKDGVTVKPILSAGDVVPNGVRKDYQMTGIPDGLGAYKAGDTLKMLMNHELDGEAPPNVGARVSRLSINPETLNVKSAGYPITGREGFLRFCSSTFRHVNGKPLYFTGEETTDNGSLTADPADGLGHGGSSIVLNANTGEHRQTRHFGLLPHENVVPIKHLARADVLTTEDGDAAPIGSQDSDPEANESQLYSYIAPTFGDAISGDKGMLHAWKPNDDGSLDSDPSTDDIQQGETLEGHFVPISQEDNSNADELEAAAQSRDTFDFVRLEDAAVSKTEPNVVYFNDTGTLGSETNHGRLYKLTIDKAHPRKASLTLLIDGDTSTNPRLTNPDNLDTSEDSIVIQEDRNSEYRGEDAPGGGYGRVLVYNLETKKLGVVARVNTPSGDLPGEWESSGVINAARLVGKNQWLLDVQAHTLEEEQPGRSLVPDSSVGEDGQLLKIKIPNS